MLVAPVSFGLLAAWFDESDVRVKNTARILEARLPYALPLRVQQPDGFNFSMRPMKSSWLANKTVRHSFRTNIVSIAER